MPVEIGPRPVPSWKAGLVFSGIRVLLMIEYPSCNTRFNTQPGLKTAVRMTGYNWGTVMDEECVNDGVWMEIISELKVTDRGIMGVLL